MCWLLLGASVWLCPTGGAARRRTSVLVLAARLRDPVSMRPSEAQAHAAFTRLASRVAGPALVVAATGVGLSVGGVPIGVAAASAAALAWRLLRRAHADRVQRRTAATLLRAVRVVVAELESGAGPPQALAAVRAVAVGDVGADVGAELAPVWRLAEDSGAPVADVVNRLARDLAAVDDRRRAVDVALAGPTSSAALLAALPVLGIGLGAAMGAHPTHVLLGTGPGRLVGAAGVLLDLAGVLWMARILRRARTG